MKHLTRTVSPSAGGGPALRPTRAAVCPVSWLLRLSKGPFWRLTHEATLWPRAEATHVLFTPCFVLPVISDCTSVLGRGWDGIMWNNLNAASSHPDRPQPPLSRGMLAGPALPTRHLGHWKSTSVFQKFSDGPHPAVRKAELDPQTLPFWSKHKILPGGPSCFLHGDFAWPSGGRASVTTLLGLPTRSISSSDTLLGEGRALAFN